MYLQKIVKKLAESNISEAELLKELKIVIKEFEATHKGKHKDKGISKEHALGEFLLQNLTNEELKTHLKNMKKLTILFHFTFPEHDCIDANMQLILGDEDSDDYNPDDLLQLTVEESEEIKELTYDYLNKEFKKMASSGDEIRVALF